MRSRVVLLAACCVAATTAAVSQPSSQTGRSAGAPAAASAVRQVRVAAIPDVVAADAQWQLVWQGTDNADGIVGTPDGGLLFAQEQPSRVRKLSPDNRVSIHTENTNGAGSLSLDAKGRLFAVQRTCTDPGLNRPCAEPTTIAIIHPEPERRVLADNFEGKPLGRLNDLVVAASGAVYFTSGGAFYVPASGGSVAAVGENLRANGIMLSRDERVLYVTNGPVVVAFDVAPDGSLAGQREFARLEAGGSGDGLAIDAEDRLYVTSNPGVQVFARDGAYLGLIPTPRPVITAAFSGPGKRMLYVVGSGAVGPDGNEFVTPGGVRNNAKTIYRLPMLTQGFTGRAK